jgi:hypothetical protein
MLSIRIENFVYLKNSSYNIELKIFKMRGFSRGADTRTSCPTILIRLKKPEMVETCSKTQVAWSLPSRGITEDLSPPFYHIQNLLFLIQIVMLC